MARYDANVSMLFTDLPFLCRFEAAAAAGIRGGGVRLALGRAA